MRQKIDLITDLVESIFKFVIWHSVVALLSASLKFQSENYLVIFFVVLFVIFLITILFIWSLFKIVLPICSLLYPHANYVEAMEAIRRIENKGAREQLFLNIMRIKENKMLFVLFFSMYFGSSYLFGILLTGYTSKL